MSDHFLTKIFHLCFLLLLCFLLMHQAAECRTKLEGFAGLAASLTAPSRKILNRKPEYFDLRRGIFEISKAGTKKKFMDSELRNVPSGPDPLHHNGATPKKPRTP